MNKDHTDQTVNKTLSYADIGKISPILQRRDNSNLVIQTNQEKQRNLSLQNTGRTLIAERSNHAKLPSRQKKSRRFYIPSDSLDKHS